MRVNSINVNTNAGFGVTNTPQPSNQKPRLLDFFYSEIKNSADLNDTVEVPRTIFKGYLAFIASTALGSLASVTKKYSISKTLTAASALSALWGTYSFVRPYIFINKPGTKEDKI